MKEFENVSDILDFAIDLEQNAVDFYTDLAGRSENEAMAEVFTQFANEEKGHKLRLQRIKANEAFEFKEEKVTDLHIADYMIRIDISPTMSYKDALILAMKREKSAYKLYSDLVAIAPPSLQKVFQTLAQEEAKHKLRFEIEYDDYVLREN